MKQSIKFVYTLIYGGQDHFLTANSKEHAMQILENAGIKPFNIYPTKKKRVIKTVSQFQYEYSLL
jgi:hypothetical protein